jgi:phosphatidylglycerophosphate synthase
MPNSGLGTSPFGAKADIIADTAALVTVGGAALIAPRMPIVSRIAVATVFGHEAFKSTWGLNKNRIWRKAGGNDNLYIKPTLNGKCSMAEKMTAVGFAVLSSDFDEQAYRQPLAAAALAFAVIGTARGEQERQDYEGIANEMIENLHNTVPELDISIAV